MIIKLIGIVGRAYYNLDNQKIIQVNEEVRKVISEFPNVTSILLLPTNPDDYVDIEMGEDKIDNFDKKKLDFILEKCDGFIVPGGSSWFWFDEYVIHHAVISNKPLLAICAGFQALCSMYAMDRVRFDMAKKLLQDTHYGKSTQYLHDIKILDSTLLKDIIGSNCIPVNSLHHDYVDFLMKDLRISALSKDEVIEAVELPNHPFLLGIQWHPEYLKDEFSKKIFQSFMKRIENNFKEKIKY